jgi:hypothetical protein
MIGFMVSPSKAKNRLFQMETRVGNRNLHELYSI